MPHLAVHVLEPQLAGNEDALVTALTDAIVGVYGEWARPLVVVRLVGVPLGRWAVGGALAETAAPEVTLGIRAGALSRPDGAEIARLVVAEITDALTGVLGNEFRDATLVELVPQHDDRVGVGGRLVGDTATG